MDRIIKTLIVDDEPVARQILREELTLIPGVELIGEAGDGNEALRKIAELRPDLVFLDLQMPSFNGFEIVRRIGPAHLPAIVVVTAFNQHAIEAFESGAIDYLLKPVRRERLLKAIERARGLLLAPAGPRKIVGRIGRDYFLLDFEEVLALQAEGELVWIVTATRRYLASQTLRSVESTLPPTNFQRVHRNAIVNIDHVRQITSITSHRWMLTLSNEQEFVVSKRQAHNIRRLVHHS